MAANAMGAKPTVSPAESMPTTAPHNDVNANGVVFGVWTPGQGGSNGGAK